MAFTAALILLITPVINACPLYYGQLIRLSPNHIQSTFAAISAYSTSDTWTMFTLDGVVYRVQAAFAKVRDCSFVIVWDTDLVFRSDFE